MGGCCGHHAPGRAVCILQKRQLEKSERELPGSFEQCMQVMLHRTSITKGLAAEGKKQQVGRRSTLVTDPAPKGWVEVVVHGVGVPWPGLCHCCPCPLSCHLTLCKETNIWAPMHCMVSVPPPMACTHPLQPPQSPAEPCPLPPVIPEGDATLTPPLPDFFPLAEQRQQDQESWL